MTVKGGTTPACAACKYQRRKCTPNCVLAPYFPANQPKMFQNVHRLFGVANITKTIKGLPTKDQKEDAMKSIIFEAEMRDRYPVYGCSVIICQLRFQLQYALEELRCVYAQLDACREQMSKQVENWPSSGMEFGGSTDGLQVFQRQSAASEMPCPVNQYFVHENSGFYAESLDNIARPLLGFDPCSDVVGNNNMAAVQAQMDAFGIQQDREIFSQNCGVLPFNITPDDRQSYIETKEACESCSESSLKDMTQSVEQVSQSELRNAAAGFSLTTVN